MTGVPADIPALIGALEPSLSGLALRGVVRAYRPGAVVAREGDAGNGLYVILSGRLRLSRAAARGTRDQDQGHYGPGEFVGEMSLDGGPQYATVAAVDLSVCAVVTRQQVQEHMAEHPEFTLRLLGKLIRRARVGTISARHRTLNDAYGRLRALLEPSLERRNDGTNVMPQLWSQQALAARIGCSHRTMSQLMDDLSAGGHVDAAGGQLRVVRGLPERW